MALLAVDSHMTGTVGNSFGQLIEFFVAQATKKEFWNPQKQRASYKSPTVNFVHNQKIADGPKGGDDFTQDKTIWKHALQTENSLTWYQISCFKVKVFSKVFFFFNKTEVM